MKMLKIFVWINIFSKFGHQASMWKKLRQRLYVVIIRENSINHMSKHNWSQQPCWIFHIQCWELSPSLKQNSICILFLIFIFYNVLDCLLKKQFSNYIDLTALMFFKAETIRRWTCWKCLTDMHVPPCRHQNTSW